MAASTIATRATTAQPHRDRLPPIKIAPSVLVPCFTPCVFCLGESSDKNVFANGVVRVDDGPGQTNAKAKTEYYYLFQFK